MGRSRDGKYREVEGRPDVMDHEPVVFSALRARCLRSCHASRRKHLLLDGPT